MIYIKCDLGKWRDVDQRLTRDVDADVTAVWLSTQLSVPPGIQIGETLLNLYGHSGFDLGTDRSGYVVWQADLDCDVCLVYNYWNLIKIR